MKSTVHLSTLPKSAVFWHSVLIQGRTQATFHLWAHELFRGFLVNKTSDCSCSHFVIVFVLSRLTKLVPLKPHLKVQMASLVAAISSEDVCCGPWPNWAWSHRPVSSTQAFVTQSEENWAASQDLLAADSIKSTLKKLYSHFWPEHVIFTITLALGYALRCFSWYHDLSRARCSSAEILPWRASFCMQWFGSPFSKPSAGVLTCLTTWWPVQNQNKQSLLCGKSCSFYIILC